MVIKSPANTKTAPQQATLPAVQECHEQLQGNDVLRSVSFAISI